MTVSSLSFPSEGYVGLAGEFAEAYSKEYESPKEFFYIDLLVFLSVMVSGRIRVEFGSLQTQPRLYGLKIGKSGWARKSTSTRIVEKFLKSVAERACFSQEDFVMLPGAGSAEGLVTAFQTKKRILLSFDEFRRFENKASIQGAILLPMLNELFDKNEYANYTKTATLKLSDAHLAFLANTTDKNFESMVDSSELIDIGFLNRLFIVSSDEQKRIPIPQDPPHEVLENLRYRFAEMLREISSGPERILAIDPNAQQLWIEWYNSLENSDCATRLDSLGMRFMALFALVSFEKSVTLEIMRSVLAVLNHQLKLRRVFTPIDGTNTIAKTEQKIMSCLRKQDDSLRRTELQRAINYSRVGGGVFATAIQNLVKNGNIECLPDASGRRGRDMYKITEDRDEAETHQLASGLGFPVTEQQECR